MKKPALIFIVAALTGCGTASSVRLSVPTVDHVGFQFLDERPAEERQSRTEEASNEVTSFYGDESLFPAAPDLFRSYMATNLADQLSGKLVKLTSFLVSASDPRVSIDGNSFNNATRSVPNANPLGVMLAAPLILGIESIRSQKTVSVRIRGSVNDQEFSSQCSTSFRGRATEDNVRSVVLTCLDQAAGDIKSNNRSDSAIAKPRRERAGNEVAEGHQAELERLGGGDCTDLEVSADINFRRGGELVALNRYGPAMQCFVRAQDQAHEGEIFRESCASIATMYELGWGVSKDSEAAKTWLKKAGL